jgi:lipopolysaccharide transport system ATP-binding protein
MEPIISVRGLGKSYRIQTGERKPYRTLRDDLADFGKGLLKGQWGNSQTEEFWAIKDIDFDIYPGEVVGIIGRNGAGKSTLLKVLSRVVQPTTGEAILRGRVASLLEVGTGFHPELTGRENIFMSGAVLGMKRTEIKDKFDEIVEFAEIEKFLDTPVKRYSSGMYVRLAFSVAAHLEPDILIVDEVLSVGDAAFQKKCIGKMENVAAQQERTILFVSHDMATITTLCQRGLWLLDGKVQCDSDIESATSKYLLHGTGHLGEVSLIEVSPEQKFFFKHIAFRNGENKVCSTFDVRELIYVNLEYYVKQSFKNLELSIRVYNSLGISIFTINRSSSNSSEIQSGSYIAQLQFPRQFLAPDSYTIDVGAHIPLVEVLSHHHSILSFDIEETGSGMNLYQGKQFGVVLVDFLWKELKNT